jgi:type I restriction enzyme, S subunit
MRTWDNPESFLNEIPNAWKHDRFKDVVSLREIRTDEKNDVEDYLELEDIESGTGQIISRRNTLGVESDVTCFRKGDVLFGKLRPYLEKYFLADFDGKCTGEILAFAPKRIEGHFLRYCVAAPWFIEKCNSLAYGAKMPRVNWAKQLALFDIPLPSREEQRRIAAYLDKACAAIEGAIRAKRKQLEVLDNLRKSIIHNAVTRGLNKKAELYESGVAWVRQKPSHWQTCRIKDACDFFNTIRVPLSAEERGQMTDKVYDYYGASGVIDKVEGYLFDGTYILIAEDGANLLRRSSPLAFIASGKFWVNNHAHILRPRFGDIEYFVHLLENLDYSLYVTGSAQPKLTKENLGRFKIIVPPVREQKQISVFLQGRIEENQALKNNLNTQIAAVERYRKSLIHEFITGKRRIE